MSARAFKKIAATQQPQPTPQEEDEEEEQEEVQPTKYKNAFELLGAEEEEDQEQSNKTEDTEQEEDEPRVVEVKKKVPVVPASTGAISKNKKKKNKQKSQLKEEISSKSAKEEEDIDELIKQFGHTDVKRNEGKEEEAPSKSIFTLDPKCLNLQNEITRVFGKQMIKKETAHSKRPTYQKKSLLVRPKPTWPRVVGGISMEFVESKNGVNYFKYVWTTSYRRIQDEFFMCVQTHDPNSFQMLLHSHPYHVDSLLQLSEVCKQTGELDTAQDLIERAIYYLECCWHHMFNPLQGNCRLDFRAEENRTFFLALFRYVQIMSRKGFSRTALEYCKLLLSMDTQDPLGVLFIIDSFAVRSQQYEYLLDLYYSQELKNNNLATLPNFVFSVALAKFHLECAKQASKHPSANDLLQYALMLFPMVVGPLAKKCKHTLTVTDQSGYSSDISKHGFFASSKCPASLQNLITLFLERNSSLWLPSEVVEWLKANMVIVTKKAEMGDPMIENCSTVLHEEYTNSQKSYYNHLLVSEFTNETVGALPADLLETIRREGGGYQLYDQFHQVAHQQPVVHAPTSNPLALFLSTLFNPVVPNAPPVQNNAAPGNNSWLNNLMDFLTQASGEQEEEHEDQ